jgi:hypothetical protein
MKQSLVCFLAVLSLCCGIPSGARATVLLSELFVGPEDGANPNGFGREFFELKSTTGGAESLAGLWLLEINGTGLDSGRVDQAINLGAAPTPSTGSNGLFLRRDNSDVLVPNPAAATVVQVGPFSGTDGLQADDNATYALVHNFSGSLGQDLDADDDGVLNLTPWTAVSDALGITESGTPGFSYAGALGGVSLLDVPFGPDAVARLANGMWFAFDAPNGEDDPTYFGPFTASDADDNILANGVVVAPVIAEQFTLTPGAANPSLVPEPSSVILSLLALMGFVGAGRADRRKI